MNGYRRYMDHQELSETGMARLVRLEVEKPEKRRKSVPQWVKYMGMAACFFLVLGLFALPIFQGAQQRANPQPLLPVGEELYFNEMDNVPIVSPIANTNGDITAPLSQSSITSLFEEMRISTADLGWKDFDLGGFTREKGESREFIISGNRKGDPGIWLELMEDYAFFEKEWEDLKASSINGCTVIAVGGEDRSAGEYRAAAAFQFQRFGVKLGVFFNAISTDEATAKELVTVLVERLTQLDNNGLWFNEVDVVPFTDQAFTGGMGLNAMEPAEAAEIFGCAPDDFAGFLKTLSLDKFDMEYYAMDMAHYPLGVVPQGDGSYRFLMKGGYISPREKPENWDETSEISWDMWQGLSSFLPRNDVWLEIYEAHSYMEEEEWKGLRRCEINGHEVAAAGDQDNYRAAAAFDVESNGTTYGVLYYVSTNGDCNAKEMVAQMVSCLTANGLVMPERETDTELPALPYAELTQLYVDEDLHAALNWKTQRPMTREELEAVFPACAGEAGENYIWYGTAYFEDDGNLQTVVITGDKMDETETVTITTSREEGLVFTRNLVKENGELTHFGTDNTRYVSGVELLRCFYVNEPGHFNNAPGACYCYAQYQLAGSPLYAEVRTSVSEGSPQENMTFNTQWFDTVNKTGLWFHTGNVDGKDIWNLPVTEEATDGAALSTHHPEPEHNELKITEIDWKDGRWTSDDEFVSYHHSNSHH